MALWRSELFTRCKIQKVSSCRKAALINKNYEKYSGVVWFHEYFRSLPLGFTARRCGVTLGRPPLVLQYFYSFGQEKASSALGLMITKHAFKLLWKGVIRPLRTLTIAFHAASLIEVIVLIFSLVRCRVSEAENSLTELHGTSKQKLPQWTSFSAFLAVRACIALFFGRITSKLLILKRVMKFNHKNRTHTLAAALIMMLLSRLALPTKLISFLWFFFLLRFFFVSNTSQSFYYTFYILQFFSNTIHFFICLSHWTTTAKWVLRKLTLNTNESLFHLHWVSFNLFRRPA